MPSFLSSLNPSSMNLRVNDGGTKTAKRNFAFAPRPFAATEKRSQQSVRPLCSSCFADSVFRHRYSLIDVAHLNSKGLLSLKFKFRFSTQSPRAPGSQARWKTDGEQFSGGAAIALAWHHGASWSMQVQLFGNPLPGPRPPMPTRHRQDQIPASE